MSVIVRTILCLLALVMFVGCEAMEPPSNDLGPQPKPVQPIKPRPIVPDGQIQRPRAIDGPTTVIRVDFSKLGYRSAASSYNVVVRSESTAEEYSAVIDASGYVDVPVVLLGEVFWVMVECDGVVDEFMLVASDCK